MKKNAKLERAIEIFVLITFPIALIAGCAGTGGNNVAKDNVENYSVDSSNIDSSSIDNSSIDNYSMIQQSYNTEDLYPLFSSTEENSTTDNNSTIMAISENDSHAVDLVKSNTDVVVSNADESVESIHSADMMKVSFVQTSDPVFTANALEPDLVEDNLDTLADTSNDVLTLGANSKMALIQDETSQPTYLTFGFDIDSINVHEYDYYFLEQHAAYLKLNPTLIVKIMGHTDASGSAIYNEELSKQRANEVAKLLLSYGVPESQISMKGLGETTPVSDESKQQENRRVELEYIENTMISTR